MRKEYDFSKARRNPYAKRLKQSVTIRLVVPGWLRPPLFGAVALFTIVSIRMLIALPVLWRHPQRLPEFGLALAAATGAGALGGLGYSLIGFWLRRLAVAGPYLAGIVTVSAYMGSLLLAAPYIAPNDPLVETSSDLAIVGAVTVFFGLVVGHQMRE